MRDADHVFINCGQKTELTGRELTAYNGAEPRFVIYLVHGTWSSGIQWISHTSHFSQGLTNRIGTLLLLNTHRWSGKNSLKARENGAQQLAKELRLGIAQFPHSIHVVIAHSHGGNIALKAISDERLHSCVALVCLSTPFLNVRRRTLSPASEKLIGMGGVLISGAILAALFARPLSLWFAAHSNWAWLDNHPWIAWLKPDRGDLEDLYWAPLGLPLLILSVFIHRSRKKAESLWEQLRYSVPDETMLKILRTRGDEASAALSTYQMLSWLITMAIRVLSIVVSKLEQFCRAIPRPRWILTSEWKSAAPSKRAVIVMINCLLISIGLLFLRLKGPRVATVFALLSFIYLGGIVFVPFYVSALIGIVLALLVIPLSILGTMSIGSDALMAAVLYDITPESTPEGTWEVCLCPPPDDSNGKHTLMHSAIYENPAALDVIAKWIRNLPTIRAFVTFDESVRNRGI